ncbi:hypothetical protein QBC43DRAFT_233681 [Cladorrhinum sp. PSN259]|nr:hypothetical protein QBC43DRAFT_233681 [Cladorrhinum sp. PSN259]
MDVARIKRSGQLLHATNSTSKTSKAARSTPKSTNGTTNPFIIITTPSAKIDPAARKQIRSHVMRGKNRKRVDPSRNTTLGSWINHGCQVPLSREVAVETAALIHSSIPGRLGTDISHIQLVDEVDPYRAKLVHTWFTTLKTTMYPIETVVRPPMDQWFEYIAYDRAYLNCVLFATQAFIDWARDQKISRSSFEHLNLAMTNLRQSLATASQAPSDSTMAVVVTLTLMSDVLQDHDAGRKHIEGLYHLVQMRGGIRTLQDNPQLQIKVLRADLGHAISTGSKPLFFSEGFSWDPYLAPHSKVPTYSPAFRRTVQNLLSASREIPDQRLINVYLDLQEFSLATNLAYQTGNKIAFEPFLETLVSAQYRLLALQTEHLENRLTTLLILGLITFTTTAFLQVRGMPMQYEDLTRQLRERLVTFDQQFEDDEKEELTRYKLWFLFMAAISVVTDPADEHLLLGAASALLARIGMTGAPWNDIRGVLREHMWVDMLHSAYGKEFYEKVQLLA